MHRLLLDGQVPELPEELRVLLERRPGLGSRPSAGEPAGRPPVDPGRPRRCGTRLPAWPPRRRAKERATTLNRAAFSLGQIVARGAPGPAEVEGGLRSAAAAAGLDEREVAATLRSGLEAGLKEPRGPKVRRRASAAPEERRVPGAGHQPAGAADLAPPPFPGATSSAGLGRLDRRCRRGDLGAARLRRHHAARGRRLAGRQRPMGDAVGRLERAAGDLGHAHWRARVRGRARRSRRCIAPLRALERRVRERRPSLPTRRGRQIGEARRATAQGVGEGGPEGREGRANAPAALGGRSRPRSRTSLA